MLKVYGVEGCGPCEVTKLFLRSRNVPYAFINVATAPDKRRELRETLGSATSGVILEDSDTMTVMRTVSIASLSRYLEAYKQRHPEVSGSAG